MKWFLQKAFPPKTFMSVKPQIQGNLKERFVGLEIPLQDCNYCHRVRNSTHGTKFDLLIFTSGGSNLQVAGRGLQVIVSLIQKVS